MWLKLDESIKSININSATEIAGLETLLHAVFRGEHALACSYLLGKHILGLRLSQQSIATLTSSITKSSEFNAIWEDSKFKILITKEGDQVKVNSQNRWSVPLKFIATKGMPRSLLLAENLTDAKLYKHAAEHYRILNRQHYKIHTELRGGGGADTPKILDHEILSQNHFIYCITDSDKSYPTAPTNSTSKQCTEKSARSKWVTFHHSMDEREAENIVPKTILEDVFEQPEHKETLIKFRKLKDCKFSPDEWCYLDLKLGTPMEKSIISHDFWKDAVSKALTRGDIDATCYETRSCTSEDKESCKCHIAIGMGEKFLEHTISYLESQSSHASAQRVKTAENRKFWLDTGESIFNWSAATERIRF